jgi:hypothetical protein
MTFILLIVYLLVSVFLGHSKKNPLFYLLFPFAVIQSHGAFLDLDFFYVGGFGYRRDLIVLSYVVVALVVEHKKSRVRFLGNTLFWLYLAYLLIILIVSAYTADVAWRAFTIFRIFAYIPIYYFLFTRIFSSVTKQQFIEFINVLLGISVVSSALYIANSSHLVSIFPYEPYQGIYFQGESFSRDFATIPIFHAFVFLLSVVLLLSKSHEFFKKEWLQLNLVLSIVVALFTFTRGLVIAMGVSLILVLLMNFLVNSGSRKRNIAYALLWLGVVSVVIMLLPRYFPSEVDYFLHRSDELTQESLESTTFGYRIDLVSEAADNIKHSNVTTIFGVGFDQYYMDMMLRMSGAWGGDIMWPFFILFTGVLGTLYFIILILVYVIGSFISFKKHGGFVYVLCFVWLCYTLMRSMNSEGFNDGTGLAMIPFALYTVEKLTLWKDSSLNHRKRFPERKSEIG